jgi:geranylgeranyl transferase type-1 subunit beta
MDSTPHALYAFAVLSRPLPGHYVAAETLKLPLVSRVDTKDAPHRSRFRSHHPPSSPPLNLPLQTYFSISTLALLGQLDAFLPPGGEQRERIMTALTAWGEGAASLVPSSHETSPSPSLLPSGADSVASHYAALAALTLLGGRPSPVWVAALRSLLPALQRPDGGVAATVPGPAVLPRPDDRAAVADAESDLRFLYSAAAAATLAGLPIPDVLDVPSALSYIRSCQTHDGGFGLVRGGREGHGGSTYCAAAALALLTREGGKGVGTAEAWGVDVDALARWLSLRRGGGEDCGRGKGEGGEGGFSGRPCKAPDACYAFWAQAAGVILARVPGYEGFGGASGLDDGARAFLQSCRGGGPGGGGGGGGGFAKEPGADADLFHTHYAVWGLVLGGCGEEVLGAGTVRAEDVDPVLGLVVRR